MTHIYHIVDQHTWNKNKNDELFCAPSLDTVGFIHCCTKEQIKFVLNNWFQDRQGLILITIDPKKLTPRLIFENSEGGDELFPHLYGPIDLQAVVEIQPNKKENQ